MWRELIKPDGVAAFGDFKRSQGYVSIADKEFSSCVMYPLRKMLGLPGLHLSLGCIQTNTE
jgi:hypothetical protein